MSINVGLNVNVPIQELRNRLANLIACTTNMLCFAFKLLLSTYEYCEKNPNKYFIDMRAEGRAISVFTKHKDNTLDFLKSTINVEKPSTSCQLKFELDNNI